MLRERNIVIDFDSILPPFSTGFDSDGIPFYVIDKSVSRCINRGNTKEYFPQDCRKKEIFRRERVKNLYRSRGSRCSRIEKMKVDVSDEKYDRFNRQSEIKLNNARHPREYAERFFGSVSSTRRAHGWRANNKRTSVN